MSQADLVVVVSCLKGAVSHALDPSAKNLLLLVVLSIVSHKLKHEGLQQDKTDLGFCKDYLLPRCLTEWIGRRRLHEKCHCLRIEIRR